MKRSGVALIALALSTLCVTSQAESLRDIYELSLANDAQLKAEQAQYLAGLESEKLGLSQLLPQVNANYDYTDSDQDTAADFLGTGDTYTNTDVDREGYQVSLNQALFDLPAWFGFQSGKELSKQAEATFAANQQNLVVRVVDAYLLGCERRTTFQPPAPRNVHLSASWNKPSSASRWGLSPSPTCMRPRRPAISPRWTA